MAKKIKKENASNTPYKINFNIFFLSSLSSTLQKSFSVQDGYIHDPPHILTTLLFLLFKIQDHPILPIYLNPKSFYPQILLLFTMTHKVL